MLRSNIKVPFKDKVIITGASILLALSVSSVIHVALNIINIIIGD